MQDSTASKEGVWPMRYLFHSSKGSVAFLTAWAIYSLMIYFDRENQIEAWLEKTNQKRPKRGSGPQEGCFISPPHLCAPLPPLYVCWSSLWQEQRGNLVKEEERGGRVGDKTRGESSSECNITHRPLGGKVNWVKCSTLPANCKRRILNGRLWCLAPLSEVKTSVVFLQDIWS